MDAAPAGPHRGHHSPKNASKQITIEIAKLVELGVEGSVKLGEPACRLPMRLVFLADQEPNHDWGQRAREAVGGEHREHHSHCEWREQVARRSLYKKYRDKHAANGERRDQGWHGDPGCAMEHSLVEWFPFLEQTMRIFDRDRAIVDEYADRQR
jgi:hypothetical protein